MTAVAAMLIPGASFTVGELVGDTASVTSGGGQFDNIVTSGTFAIGANTRIAIWSVQ